VVSEYENTTADASFDDLARSIADDGMTRRRAVALVGSSIFGGALASLGLAADADARKKKKKKKKKKKDKTFNFIANPMTGAQEVAPTIGDPIGVGNSSFSIKGNRICGTFNLTQATSFTVTGTHIHEGGSTVNGPIVVDFGVATLGVETCLTCTGTGPPCNPGILGQIKANPSGFYANIHTTPHPNGAVRGQLQQV
jgi:hypothetical protein